MKTALRKHFWYYFFFLAVEIIGVCLIFFSSFNKPMQYVAIGFTIGFYIVWSILHHHLHHSLTAKIVLEYVLVGIIGAIALLFFTQ